MKTVKLDVRGHKCPVPVLKMTVAVLQKDVEPGDTMEVLADCPTFETDVRTWCDTMHKVLILLKHEPDNVKRAQVRI
jgi:tRNA 2-thiouridine synthesizing protein A